MTSSNLRASHRYSKALFNLALGRNELERVAADMVLLGELLDGTPQLQTVLQHPRITRERKKELLHDIIEDKVSADVEHFLLFLIDKQRAPLLHRTITQFARLFDEYRKQVDVEAVSAIALTPEQEQALTERLRQASGYTIRLKTRIDENILGGLIIRIGDKLIDGSIATQLQALRIQFQNAKVA